MNEDKYHIDQILYHLRKIPLLSDLNAFLYYAEDIFLIKKFLLHCRATEKLLSPELLQMIHWPEFPDNLLDQLDPEKINRMFFLFRPLFFCPCRNPERNSIDPEKWICQSRC